MNTNSPSIFEGEFAFIGFKLFKKNRSIRITKNCSFLNPFFIHLHRKDISHERNPDAPRKSDPDIIANRLPSEQRTYRINNGGDWLVLHILHSFSFSK